MNGKIGLIICICAMVFVCHGSVKAAVLFSDNFTADYDGAPVDSTKWVWSDYGSLNYPPMYQYWYGVTLQENKLQVHGGFTGSEWVYSTRAFDPSVDGSIMLEFDEGDYGSYANGWFGFMNHWQGGAVGGPDQIAIFIGTYGANIYAEVYNPVTNQSAVEDTKIPVVDGINLRHFMIIRTTTTVRMAIDKDNDGKWDFDKTYAIPLVGALPVYFWDMTVGTAPIRVDNVVVRTAPTTCADKVAIGWRMPGDINGDCYVNFKDIAMLAQNWLGCNDPQNALCTN